MEDCHLISNFLGYHKEDEKLEMFVHSIKCFIFNDSSIENNDNSYEDDLDHVSSEKKEIIFLFYEKLDNVLKKFPAYLQTKYITPNIFKFFYENDREFLKEKMIIIFKKLDMIFNNIECVIIFLHRTIFSRILSHIFRNLIIFSRLKI